MEYYAQIHALLFYQNESMTVSMIAKLLSISREETERALKELEEKLKGLGTTLVVADGAVQLGTDPSLGEFIERVRKEELSKELTKASLETLSIISYKNGATRSDIDFIRGVNSSFILRNLQIRGLIEKIPSPTDQRKFIYRPTVELLSFLGVNTVSELPSFRDIETRLTKELASIKVTESIELLED